MGAWSDGFEACSLPGNWTSETGANATRSCASDQKKEGTYSYKVVQTTTAGYGYVTKTITAETGQVNIRAYFRVDSLLSGNWKNLNRVLTMLNGANYICAVGYWTNGSGQQCLRVSRWYPAYSERAPVVVSLVAGTWHCIELEYVRGVSGSYKIWFDGTLVDSDTEIDTTGAGNINALWAGCAVSATDAVKTYWIDSFKQDTAYIGPIPPPPAVGGILAQVI